MKVSCTKHKITYEQTIKTVGGAEIESGVCPECAREFVAATAKENQREVTEQARVVSLDHKRKQQSQRFERVGIPPRFRSRSFDNYQATNTGQQAALRRARAYSSRICDGGCGGLILSGGPGTGKTHLACAIGMAYESKGKSVVFMTVVEMIRNLRESYRKDSETKLQEAINHFRDLDLLILDEVGVQSGTDDELLLLTDVINARYGWMKPTVLISNLSVPDLDPVLGARIIDRMREDGGALIEFSWESFRTKAAQGGTGS
ncbi:ATP-binding protein [Methylophaga sp. OBS4]|uniref:ATP-binding protein n=1 Tax=Methylophaga sp. OBS4 TaxID=2991935 RepID=UPI00224CDC40|nr:ATP-binding protein [Methylophaga sp. OBS4]MCX4186754.1 ATP-binding protein [Methylophaga sp. OBS4]